MQSLEKRKCFFDMEVDTDFDREFKDVFNAADRPIVSFQAYDSYTKKYFLFLFRDDLKPRKYKIKIEGINDILDVVEFDFNTEEDMLVEFIKFCRIFEFDAYSGFNIEGYDFPYLFRRLKNLNIPGVDGSGISSLKIAYYSDKRRKTIIQGSIIFDIILMMRGFIGKQKEGNSLNALSMKFLGIGKLTVDSRKMLRWYRTHLLKFKRYGMIDVQLCVMLDKKLGLIEMAESIIEFSYIMPKYYLSAGKCVEGLIFATRDKNIVFDNNLDIDVSGVPGAHVFENPKRLFYDYGAVGDFGRLYPNIMRTFNISPETIIMYNAKKYNKEEWVKTPNNRYMAKKKPVGIFPKQVVELFKIRDLYEKKMKSIEKGTELYKAVKRQRQNAKDRVNTISGMFDSKYSRFKSVSCADAIRATGKYFIILVSEIAEKNGYELMYGDTDSIFIKSKINYDTGSKEEILESVKDINIIIDIINDEFNKMLGVYGVDHWIGLGLEKVFDSYISIGVKKKYIMHKVWEDGEFVDITYSAGFEIKRSDSSDFSYTVQDTIFNAISKRTKKEELERMAKEFVEKMKNEDPYKVGIPKSLSKSFGAYKVTNPWLEGAIYSNKYLGTNFSAGSNPRLLYISKVPKGFEKTDRICIDIDTNINYAKETEKGYTDGFLIDWELMIEKNILDKVDDVLDLFGIDINYIRTGLKQMKISDWL